MRNPNKTNKFIRFIKRNQVWLYLVALVIAAIIGTELRFGSEINSLKAQRDEYEAEADSWRQTALEREEAINMLTEYRPLELEPVVSNTTEEDIDEENTVATASTSNDKSGWVYAGEFLCTAYCTERYAHICGEGKGITASGAPVQAGTTVAADTSVFPFGTVLYIEDVGYRTVQDTGSAIKKNKLDVAVDTHSNALSWSGYGYHKVWVVSYP